MGFLNHLCSWSPQHNELRHCCLYIVMVTFSFRHCHPPHSLLLINFPPRLCRSLGPRVSRLPADKADQCWKRLLQIWQIRQTGGDTRAHSYTKTPQHAFVPLCRFIPNHFPDAFLLVCVCVCEPISGANTSRAAGQSPRRAAQTESKRAWSGPGRRGGQAWERGTRRPAGVLQGEHEPRQKVHRSILSQLCDIYLITVITAQECQVCSL